MQIGAVGSPILVDESLRVLGDRIHDQSIALVMPNRFAVPGRLWIFRMRHIQIYMTYLVIARPNHQNFLWRLDEVGGRPRIQMKGACAGRPAARRTGEHGEAAVLK